MFARQRVFLIPLFLATVRCAAQAEDLRPDAPALPEQTEPDDAHDVLFLASERPIFIRLHVKVDGRSFRSAWRDFGERLFHELDYNGDGVLSGSEWESIPSPDLLVDGTVRGSPQGADSVRASLDVAPPDGLVTRREFTDYLFARGIRALSLEGVGPDRTGYGFGPNGAGEQLFERLDTDHDGRLSPDEFTAGPRVLARIDFDDDGSFSLNELQLG